MEKEQKELKSLSPIKEIHISKKGYTEHTVLLSSFGLDKDREKKFNEGKKIKVTEDELLAIGEHRWLSNI